MVDENGGSSANNKAHHGGTFNVKSTNTLGS